MQIPLMYIGPGLGIGTIAIVLIVILIIIASLLMIIWTPIKNLIKKIRQKISK